MYFLLHKYEVVNEIFSSKDPFFSSKTLTFLCRTLTFRSFMSIWSRRSPSSLDIRFFSCVAWRAWAVFFSMVLFLSSNLPRSSSTYVSNKVIIRTLSCCYTYSFLNKKMEIDGIRGLVRGRVHLPHDFWVSDRRILKCPDLGF